MPEGPEIRQAADALDQVLRDQTIIAAVLNHEALSGKSRHIKGHTVTAVDCHGKAMLTHFSSGWTLYSHNQLYGVWKIVERGTTPNTNRSLRIALHTDSHSALLYSATDIELWKTDRLSEHPFLSRLGPDILASDTEAATVLNQLRHPAWRRRQIASLYLDQGFIAGIGNYLRSEILYFAGVHPLSRPVDLDRAALSRLARNTVSISRRSYRTGGITLPKRLLVPGTVRGRRNYESNRFAVFARAGKPCRSCHTPVRKSNVTSRRIYWCPECQPEI